MRMRCPCVGVGSVSDRDSGRGRGIRRHEPGQLTAVGTGRLFPRPSPPPVQDSSLMNLSRAEGGAVRFRIHVTRGRRGLAAFTGRPLIPLFCEYLWLRAECACMRNVYSVGALTNGINANIRNGLNESCIRKSFTE